MVRLLSKIARLIASNNNLPSRGGVARQLLERAEASAGRDPRQAQALRNAASAYLSVVR